jgi:hypothetical protein
MGYFNWITLSFTLQRIFKLTSKKSPGGDALKPGGK